MSFAGASGSGGGTQSTATLLKIPTVPFLPPSRFPSTSGAGTRSASEMQPLNLSNGTMEPVCRSAFADGKHQQTGVAKGGASMFIPNSPSLMGEDFRTLVRDGTPYSSRSKVPAKELAKASYPFPQQLSTTSFLSPLAALTQAAMYLQNTPLSAVDNDMTNGDASPVASGVSPSGISNTKIVLYDRPDFDSKKGINECQNRLNDCGSSSSGAPNISVINPLLNKSEPSSVVRSSTFHHDGTYSGDNCLKDAEEELASFLNQDQCSRTTPGLLEYYSKRKQRSGSSSSVSVSVTVPLYIITDTLSPISVTSTSPKASKETPLLSTYSCTSPITNSRETAVAKHQVNNTYHSATGTTTGVVGMASIIRNLGNRHSRSESKKKRRPESTQKYFFSSGTKTKISKDAECRPEVSSTFVSASTGPLPTTTPHWQLPTHPPLNPSLHSSFWLPPTDHNGHGLVWAGYPGIAPPVLMSPQQLLLGDAHLRALHAHAAYLQVPSIPPVQNPPSDKCQAISPTKSTEDSARSKTPTSPVVRPTSSNLPIPPYPVPHFLLPSHSALPYFYHQSSHQHPFSFSHFPSVPTTFSTAHLSTVTATSAFSPSTEICRSVSTPIPTISSPSKIPTSEKSIGSHFAAISSSSCPEHDELLREACNPSAESAVDISTTPSIKIKQEIKEEILSPVNASLASDTDTKISDDKFDLPSLKGELSVTQVQTNSVQQETSRNTDLDAQDISNSEENDLLHMNGLELLSHSVLLHANKLQVNLEEDNESVNSEPMPCLEVASPLLSPFASDACSDSPPLLTPHFMNTSSPLAGLNILCALAEQRMLEEQQQLDNGCSALSSLAAVAATSPPVPIDNPTSDDLIHFSEEERILSPESSRSYSQTNNLPEISTGFSEARGDINRNYKSPQSEKEVKAYIASKASQYHRESGYYTPPGLQIDLMDPTELDMRMQLAELQRKYKENQKTLSRLQPKREMLSPSKRGPGRPKKSKEEKKKRLGQTQGKKRASLSKQNYTEKSSDIEEDDKMPYLIPFEVNPEESLLSEEYFTKEKGDQVTSSNEPSGCAISAQPADDDSEDESPKECKSSIEVSFIESCPSDADQPLTLSSSKKRKPGRPKKHSPSEDDSTETIVAKKAKDFLLHGPLFGPKTKVKPKLKAEVKVRGDEGFDEGEATDRSHNTYSADEEGDDEDEICDKKVAQSVCPSFMDGTVNRGGKAKRVRHNGNLTRKAILQDKEKRKSAAEKQQQMEALYRSLKKHSKLAVVGHDESDEEKEKADEDVKPLHFELSAETKGSTASEMEEENLAEVKEEAERLCRLLEDYQESVEEDAELDVCMLDASYLIRGARILVLVDGLLYAGSVTPISPPNIYHVVIDGERCSRPHVYCEEQLLLQSWKEVKPGSTRFLTEGTRVCAFWSQQYRALYPGCIAPPSSPLHENNHNFVNVEFDDGDSGRIHVDDIRLLPSNFPITVHDPNPLLSMNKKKRRLTGENPVENKVELIPKKTKAETEAMEVPSTSTGKLESEKIDAIVNIRKAASQAMQKIKTIKKENKSPQKQSIKGKALKIKFKNPPKTKTLAKQRKDESSDLEEEASSSHEEYTESEEESTSKKKSSKSGPKKRSKSKMAPFLPERLLWSWNGKGFKRPGSKGRGKKEFYKEIVRGDESIRVGDCAVFLSTGKPDRPYIGHIEMMWESWGGNMLVKVKWFYHPQETKGGKKLAEPKGALFQSMHMDENDVQTISHKCDVVTLSEYRARRAELEQLHGPDYENNDIYYIAGFYDPIQQHVTMEPGVS